MTITDYLINAVFVFVVLRQARERKVDARSFLAPMAVVLYVAHMYVHSIPTAGNDLVLVGVLASVGLALGVLGGFATHVRIAADGSALARVGWIAGALLIAGITSRLVFVYAVHHGAYHAVSAFSIANHIGAAAWPVGAGLDGADRGQRPAGDGPAARPPSDRRAGTRHGRDRRRGVITRIASSARPARSPRAGWRSIVCGEVTATEEPASVVGTPAPAGSESARVAEAQTRAERGFAVSGTRCGRSVWR